MKIEIEYRDFNEGSLVKIFVTTVDSIEEILNGFWNKNNEYVLPSMIRRIKKLSN